jgi:hypothetical protein
VSKYDRLGAFLRENGKAHISMTFAEIERVVGAKLPKSQDYPAWWSNSTSNNVMTRIWLDAGYRTEQVDVAARKLVFRRVVQSLAGMHEESRMFKHTETDGPSVQKISRHPAFGAMKGMMTIEPGYDIAASDPEIVAEWAAAIERKAALAEAGLKRKP